MQMLLPLLLACGTTDPDDGYDSVHHDSGHNDRGPCAPGTSWSVSADDEFHSGVTVAELAAMAEGTHQTTVQLYGRSDEVALTITMTTDLDGAEVTESESCERSLRIPGTLTLQTPDGELAESWSVGLRTVDVEDVGFEKTLSYDGTGLSGTLDPAVVLEDGWELHTLSLYCQWEGDSVRGHIAQAAVSPRGKKRDHYDLAIWPFGGEGFDDSEGR